MGALPEISLGTAALIFFGGCILYLFLRGIIRILVNTVYIAISAWVGFRVWQQAPSFAMDWLGQPPEFVAIGLAVAAFLLTLLLLRKVIRFFCSPLARGDDDAEPRSGGGFIFRLIFTLVPAALLCLIAATFIHHASSVAEIKGGSAKASFVTRLNDSLSAYVPEKFMDWLDPLTTEPRLRLAKMIAARADSSAPVIDPQTNKPYPRALIVEDPELLDLAREGRFSALLRHPLFSKALQDPRLRQALGL